MEIIKKGKANRSIVWRCECPLCGTQVKIIQGDPDIIRYHNCMGSFSEEVTWKCPVCETEVLSKTGEHRQSPDTNVISRRTEVISAEEKDMVMSWGCVNLEDDHPWYTGKWDSNN